MRAFVFVLVAAFVVLVLWVAFANASQVVTLTFGLGGGPREVSLAWVILGGVLAGTIFIGVLAVIEGVVVRLENLRLRRRVRRLEEEVADLRNMVLEAPGEGAPGRDRLADASGPGPGTTPESGSR